jgi:DNA polymerase (family X)
MGAEIVESHAGDITQMARNNDLAGIKGLGEALCEKRK